MPFTANSAVSLRPLLPSRLLARLAWLALVSGLVSTSALALPVQDGVPASAAGQGSVSRSEQVVDGGLTGVALLSAPLANSLGSGAFELEGEAVANGPITEPGAAMLSPVRASLVPEAGQWLLMLGGALMMGFHLRRRLAGHEARPSRH